MTQSIITEDSAYGNSGKDMCKINMLSGFSNTITKNLHVNSHSEYEILFFIYLQEIFVIKFD